jgi:hypothetical protein
VFLSFVLAVVLSLAITLSADAADAQGKTCVLSEPEKATVAEILDGETLKLSDGRVVRLIGAKAPSAPLGWRATILGLWLRTLSKRSTSSPRAKRWS